MPALGFSIEESYDGDGVARLGLVGELDAAVAEHLLTRIGLLVARGTRVRIDLSRLRFIDSRGVYALIRAVKLGREAGGQLVEIDPKLGANVQDVLELTGVTRLLWPDTACPGGRGSPPHLESSLRRRRRR